MKNLLLVFILFGCSNAPNPKTVELDLCTARRTERALELAVPTLQPVPGSARERVEETEDQLCATLVP